MELIAKNSGEFTYIDEGSGPTMLLLHGLFGALSNWEGVVKHYKSRYRVLIPLMPIYEMPLKEAGIDGLAQFIERFVKHLDINNLLILGNSLGGHVGLVYLLKNPEKGKALVLTGSSGLFESSMGGSYPKRGSYDYIKERVEYTFFRPETATPTLVKEVFETTKSIPKCLRIVAIAKSAQRENLATELHKIKIPTLLVWGLNDTITPPTVAWEFHKLIPNTTLTWIDECCHAPMMEVPDTFNAVLDKFLKKEGLEA